MSTEAINSAPATAGTSPVPDTSGSSQPMTSANGAQSSDQPGAVRGDREHDGPDEHRDTADMPMTAAAQLS